MLNKGPTSRLYRKLGHPLLFTIFMGGMFSCHAAELSTGPDLRTCVATGKVEAVSAIGLVSNVNIGYHSIKGAEIYSCVITIKTYTDNSEIPSGTKLYLRLEQGDNTIQSCFFANDIYVYSRAAKFYACKEKDTKDYYLRSLEYNENDDNQ
ncbi:hypothetical protein [Serratia ficaria]|uniref:hypothetical protein n=1 Tax=Serratia ficaria TaxID=61651 RepID=UPI0021777C03|nr:hypothetical protein [Serratia ficaria]CAI1123565.1 Uncharacterised protein [Serratia ficaria]CAI1541939.1 Uncharacterised protein [Serratia ficaria]CAI2539374.1 Uncharacterised protein [Serratia ficaria]